MGTPAFIPAEETPDFIPAEDAGPPGVKSPIPRKGTLPNGGDTGEGPIAQGLTTMERKFADMGRSALQGSTPEERKQNLLSRTVGKSASSLNPIATDEGSLPMNIGATAANLLPMVVDAEGITESPLGKVAKGATDAVRSPAAAKIAQSAKVVGKAAGTTAENLPVLGAVVKGGKALGELRDVWKPGPKPVYPGAHLPEHPGIFPGAPLPETPPIEVLQANSLTRGAAPTAPEPSSVLSKIPVKGATPQNLAAARIPQATPAAESGEALAEQPAKTSPGILDSTKENRPYAGEKEPPTSKPAVEPMAYRARSVGDQGVPYKPETRAQATTSEAQARSYEPGRGDIVGKPQETVGINLAKTPGFSVMGDGPARYVKFHGDVPEQAIRPLGEAKPSAPAATIKPTVSKIADQVESALGGKKLAPNVPLRQQGPAALMEPEHMGQFARANGLDLHKAIPETPQGDVLRAKIHNMTNVQVRQLAINTGEDMGQSRVGNRKGTDDVPRQEVLKRIMAKHSPEEIGKLIDEGHHLENKRNPHGQ